MSIPFAYNLRNLVVRKTTTMMTALGIALTVAVLLAILALVNGLRSTLSVSGDPLHVLVLRKGSDSELVSIFLRSQFQDLKFKTGIATGRDGQPLASMEVVTIMILEGADDASGANLTVRGLGPAGIEMRRNVHLARGRWFRQGQREVVVGKSVADRFPSAQIGKKVHFGRGEWEIVGVFDASGGAQSSEVWGDLFQVSSDLQRVDAVSSCLVTATDAVTAKALVASLNDDQRLGVKAMFEKDYYDQQTSSAKPIESVGHHYGDRQQFRRHEHHVRGGSAARPGNRHAARVGLLKRQHSGQLSDGIGGALGTGRRARMFAGAAFKRSHHRHRQLQFLGNCFRISCDAANHAHRRAFRGNSGQRRRTIPGPHGVAQTDFDGTTGGLNGHRAW